MKPISILGSTGSIGRQCLDVVASNPGKFQIVALAAGHNVKLAAEQAQKYHPQIVSVATEAAAEELCQALKSTQKTNAANPEILFGPEGMERVATHEQAEMVVSAAVGVVGLPATYKAIEAGKHIALANKEVLVAAGEVVMAAVHRHKISLLPVDSEHNAIHQCLRAGESREVKRLILTASGGPFRKTPLSHFAKITPKQALNHPNWKMGQRITIDSATLMNKGLELIEACLMFGLPVAQVQILLHPQSIVHSLVEYADGSVLAQLGAPDMRTPIAHALAWPERIDSGVEFLDLLKVGRLDFRAPDTDKFRCLALAQAAARAGGLQPVVLNAANEVAVEAFLGRRLNFTGIAAVIEAVVERSTGGAIGGLEDVLAADAESRVRARERIFGFERSASVRGAHA